MSGQGSTVRPVKVVQIAQRAAVKGVVVPKRREEGNAASTSAAAGPGSAPKPASWPKGSGMVVPPRRVQSGPESSAQGEAAAARGAGVTVTPPRAKAGDRRAQGAGSLILNKIALEASAQAAAEAAAPKSSAASGPAAAGAAARKSTAAAPGAAAAAASAAGPLKVEPRRLGVQAPPATKARAAAAQQSWASEPARPQPAAASASAAEVAAAAAVAKGPPSLRLRPISQGLVLTPQAKAGGPPAATPEWGEEEAGAWGGVDQAWGEELKQEHVPEAPDSLQHQGWAQPEPEEAPAPPRRQGWAPQEAWEAWGQEEPQDWVGEQKQEDEAWGQEEPQDWAEEQKQGDEVWGQEEPQNWAEEQKQEDEAWAKEEEGHNFAEQQGQEEEPWAGQAGPQQEELAGPELEQGEAAEDVWEPGPALDAWGDQGEAGPGYEQEELPRDSHEGEQAQEEGQEPGDWAHGARERSRSRDRPEGQEELQGFPLSMHSKLGVAVPKAKGKAQQRPPPHAGFAAAAVAAPAPEEEVWEWREEEQLAGAGGHLVADGGEPHANGEDDYGERLPSGSLLESLEGGGMEAEVQGEEGAGHEEAWEEEPMEDKEGGQEQDWEVEPAHDKEPDWEGEPGQDPGHEQPWEGEAAEEAGQEQGWENEPAQEEENEPAQKEEAGKEKAQKDENAKAKEPAPKASSLTSRLQQAAERLRRAAGARQGDGEPQRPPEARGGAKAQPPKSQPPPKQLPAASKGAPAVNGAASAPMRSAAKFPPQARPAPADAASPAAKQARTAPVEVTPPATKQAKVNGDRSAMKEEAPEEQADEAEWWKQRRHPGFAGIAALVRTVSNMDFEWEEEEAELEEEEPEEEEPDDELADEEDDAGEGKGDADADGEMKEQAKQDDKICWDFVAGRCKRGDRCWYVHATDQAAKAAAARSLVRAGKHWCIGGLSEAAAKLAALFTTSGLDAGDKKMAATKEQEQEWHLRCNLVPLDEAGDVHVLDIGMSSVGLNDDGMLAWAFWMDKRLTALRGEEDKARSVSLHVQEVDFSGNELASPAIRTLCALLEKYAVHCDVVRLDGNKVDDDGLRDIARYLTSFEKAPVHELGLSRNQCSVRGVGWLLSMLAMHPAYPVYHEDSKQFWPLRLHLGEELLASGGDKLEAMIRDLGEACSISIGTGNEEDAPVGTAGEGKKHNCVAHLCGWEPSDSLSLPRASPYAQPIFGKPIQESAIVDGAQRSLPLVLYEYGEIAVVFKPSGWICGSDHPDSKLASLPPRERSRRIEALTKQEESASLQVWILLHFGAEKNSPVSRDPQKDNGLCHRLDVGTSGPVLVAKTERGYDYAKTQIHERDVVKDYLALVHGSVSHNKGLTGACREPIDRSTYESTRRVRVAETGDPAVSLWEVLAEYESPDRPADRYTLVHVRIITGRTHQIRAHMAHMGHPLVSDWAYAADEATLWRDDKLCKRIFLHKFRISFVDMQGSAASVSCSLQMDSLLWNCLKQLRLVGGMALHGCSAPGIRGVGARPGQDGRRPKPAVAAGKTAASGAKVVPARVGFAPVKRATPAPKRAASGNLSSQPQKRARADGRREPEPVPPPQKRPRLVSPRRSGAGGGAAAKVVPPRQMTPRPPAAPPAPRTSGSQSSWPSVVPPSRQRQQEGAQASRAPASRPAVVRPSRPAVQQQRASEGSDWDKKVFRPHAKTLTKLPPPPAVPASASSGGGGSGGGRFVVGKASGGGPTKVPARKLPPRPVPASTSKPLVARAGSRSAIGASARGEPSRGSSSSDKALVRQPLYKVSSQPQRSNSGRSWSSQDRRPSR